MTFGEYIRERRICLQLTLREASNKTKISITRLSKLENHRTLDVPTEFEIESIRTAYQINDMFYDELAIQFVPDHAGIERQNGLFQAIESGMSDEELLNRFGVFVHRSGNRACIEAENDLR